jgi:hypothetical protein
MLPCKCLRMDRMFLQTHRYALGVLLALAIAMRMLVPAGWMPSDVKGQMITICTGMDLTEVWLGHDGKIQKEAPVKKSKADQTCVFAYQPAASIDFGAGTYALLPSRIEKLMPASVLMASIGRGLAAPPPYSTGPPKLI